MMLPKVYVAVLNWNNAADTCVCLESLLALDYPNVELVLCDNASRPESVEAIRQWAAKQAKQRNDPRFLRELGARDAIDGCSHADGVHRITLIHTGGNLGFAGGMNMGARYALARGDLNYLWILNNDTEVPPDALTHLVRHALANPQFGIIGSSLIYDHDRQMLQACGGASYNPWRGRSSAIRAFDNVSNIPADPSEVESRMAYVIGAAMLVSASFLRTVGLMDEAYFLYSEEHDWAYKGQKAGFKLGYAPKSHVFHKHGATIGTSSKGGSPKSLYYLYRAKAVFARRHTPRQFPVVLLSLAWDGCKFALKRQPAKSAAVFRGIRASFNPKLGKA
ncbi:MAG: glycosyltransferase family 2 protein [Nitrospira sp.]|nr:glycosyltransferase family 2 protein [Nitrospira sp.]